MVIPVVMLVVLALVVMRALMGAVAHEETAAPVESITLEPTLPGTPAPELRARADDGVRAFLTEAATSRPPWPAPRDADPRAEGSPAVSLMPAAEAEPEISVEHDLRAERSTRS